MLPREPLLCDVRLTQRRNAFASPVISVPDDALKEKVRIAGSYAERKRRDPVGELCRDLPPMNAAYRDVFTKDFPARATIGVGLGGDALVEIMFTALK